MPGKEEKIIQNQEIFTEIKDLKRQKTKFNILKSLKKVDKTSDIKINRRNIARTKTQTKLNHK